MIKGELSIDGCLTLPKIGAGILPANTYEKWINRSES